MATRSSSSETRFHLKDQNELQEYLIKLLENAQRKVAIFSHNLTPMLFDQPEIINELSRISRSHRLSKVFIIISNIQKLENNQHNIIKLSHRLPSKISIKKLDNNIHQKEEFLLIDNIGFWLKRDINQENGIVDFSARPEVSAYWDRFNFLWENSAEDTRVRQLFI